MQSEGIHVMGKKTKQPTKHSAVAKDLRTPKYRMKVKPNKKKANPVLAGDEE